MDTPNYILATFMKFNDVPMTEHGAIAEGWKKTDTKSCDGELVLTKFCIPKK